MNHWHNYENSLFKTLSIFLNPHVGRRDRCHLHTNRSLRPIMIGEDHLYITEKGAVQEQSLAVQCTLISQPKIKNNMNTNQKLSL